MAAEILHLRSPLRWSTDWSQQDIAEFYRVESALIQAGFDLHTDRGLSDEGDPWFIFCRADSGEVFIHFARIDGEYVVDAGASGQAIRGTNFTALVRDIIEKQPLIQARSRSSKNVFLHPAALLIALVGGAFFHSHEAKAATTHPDHGHADSKRQIVFLSGASKEAQDQTLDSVQVAAILTGVMIGLDRQMDLAPPPVDVVHAAAVGGPPPPPPPPGPPPGPLDGPSRATDAVLTAAAPYDAHLGIRALDIVAPQTSGPDHTPPIHLSLSAPPETALVWPTALSPPQPSDALAHNAYAGLSSDLISIGGDASQAIQWAESMANISPAAVLQMTRLPVSLADLINHGAQAGSHPATILSSAPATPETTDPTGTTTVNPPASVPAPAPAAATFDPHDPAVVAAGVSFLAVIQIPDVIVTGHGIVIYDGAIMSSLPKGAVLESLTFQFNDGTTLSLVGTAPEIQSVHWVA